MDKPYLTIKEAIEYTSKSESTIKKLIRDIRNNKVEAEEETLIKVTDGNGVERNEILKQFLKTRYDIEEKQSPDNKLRDKEIEYLKREIESLKRDKEYYQKELTNERERSQKVVADILSKVTEAIQNNPPELPPAPKPKGLLSKLFGNKSK